MPTLIKTGGGTNQVMTMGTQADIQTVMPMHMGR